MLITKFLQIAYVFLNITLEYENEYDKANIKKEENKSILLDDLFVRIF